MTTEVTTDVTWSESRKGGCGRSDPSELFQWPRRVRAKLPLTPRLDKASWKWGECVEQRSTVSQSL